MVGADVGRRQFLGMVGMGVGGGLLMTVGTAQGSAGLTEQADPGMRQVRAYVGTYTGEPAGGKGVGLAAADAVTGALTSVGVLAGVANPSFLALSPSGRLLYAVDEQTDGSVTACALENDGHLRRLNSQPSKGADPCHLVVHPSGRYVLSANYSSGSVVVHPVRADGSLGSPTDVAQHTGSGPDPDRQAGPHAHQVLVDPARRNVLAVDLGTDSVYVYKLDLATGRLRARSQARFRAGAGPRHLAIHPTGMFAYVVNELDSTIVVCGYDADRGVLTVGEAQRATPPDSPAGVRNLPAEVLVSADGRFVYVSNRGQDSIAIFAVEDAGARLRLVAAPSCGGEWPRHIVLTAGGRLLHSANQNSGTVTTFRVDQLSGGLTPSGTALITPTPVCVLPR